MTLKNDWVDENTPGHTSPDWTFTSMAANAVADAVNGLLDAGVSTVTPTAVKTSAYNAAVGDLVPCDATGGGFTVTLPEAPADKSVIAVKKLDATAEVVTIGRSGSDVFNIEGGATSLPVVMQDQTVVVQYEAAAGIWYVTGHGTPVGSLDDRYRLAGTSILDANGNLLIDCATVADQVNHFKLTPTVAGAGTTIVMAAEGASTLVNVGALPKGGGTFNVMSDSAGTSYNIGVASSYVELKPVNSGSSNISTYLDFKGNGKIYAYALTTGNTPTIAADGVDSAHDLNLISKGTGVVKANGEAVVRRVSAPASASASGTAGDIAYDASYVYICTATDTWLRASIATWT